MDKRKFLIMGGLVAAAMMWAPCALAQTVLFSSDVPNHIYYRIPAIVEHKGKMIMFSDDRSGVTNATVWGDIGSEGNISIVTRTSADYGKTWSDATIVAARGEGESGFNRGHGDAAVVCDRKSGLILMLCASGHTGYPHSRLSVAKDADGNYALNTDKALHVGRYYSSDGGATWTEGSDITSEIYGIFNEANAATCADASALPVQRLFFASGRICQSSLIKHGEFYRIYSAVCSNRGALVVYSDDLGMTWHALGGKDARPAPKGDESKVEELPDGRVLLSCRTHGGRIFNIFDYASEADGTGEWGTPALSNDADGGVCAINNACNGEVLVVPVCAGGQKGAEAYLVLQSVPYGKQGSNSTSMDSRCNVSIYWKVLNSSADCEKPIDFAKGWTRYQVSDTSSAYSTMVLDNHGDVAFAYENDGEVLQLGVNTTDAYQITYKHLTVEEITGGKYKYCGSKKHRKNFLKKR